MQRIAKRKKFTLALLVYVSSMVLGTVAIGFSGKSSLQMSKGTEEDYVLNLSKDHGLDFSDKETLPNSVSVGKTTTKSGNVLKFACYNQYTNYMPPHGTNWMYFNYGGGFTAGYEGYVYNITPITGMKTITISSNSTKNHVKLQWSGDTNFNNEDSVILPFNFIDGKAIATYDFLDKAPNHIKISNAHTENKGIGLIETTITYSCINSYASVITNVNNETMGTVSGNGVYRIGSNVTLNATPNEGYTFNGWYDGLSRRSTDTSFTINDIAGDINLTAVFQEKVPEIVGSTFNFGHYPQKKVTDSNLIDDLNTLSGELPTSGDFGSWKSLGYDLPSDGLEYFYYQDINHTDGYKYRGIYFSSYRSEQGSRTSNVSNTSQDNYGYNLNTRYWFKYEPIQWKVLSVKEDDHVLLVSNIILDAQSYSSDSIAGRYNEYFNSGIRDYLINDFTSLAFSTFEKNAVKDDTVSNAATTFAGKDNDRDTFERVFLLSWEDVKNASYGFNNNDSRKKTSSDYAKSQGLVHTGRSENYWWTRSPSNSTINAFEINYIGEVVGELTTHVYGVAPAIRIIL